MLIDEKQSEIVVSGQVGASADTSRPEGAALSKSAFPKFGDTIWGRSFKYAFYRFLYVAVPSFVWIMLGLMNIFSFSVEGSGSLILSVVLFILAMPLSLFFRFDEVIQDWTTREKPEYGLLIMLGMVFLNFLTIAILVNLLRYQSPTQDKQSKSS